MKVLTIVGARPQFIKCAPVSKAFGKCGINDVLVHTGQHYDPNLSDVFFRELEIPKPDYNLEVGSGSHGQQTGRMLERVEQVALKERPDWILVYGDTNSTLAGALVASKLHVKLAHVEAGLRSFNRRMPEEVNRVLTDHVADLLLTPTKLAAANLMNEGIAPARIKEVGDVMYDAALFYGAKAEFSSSVLKQHGLEPQKYVLTTVHRAENTDDTQRLRTIFDGLCRVAETVEVVLPLHPRTLKALEDIESLRTVRESLKVIEPVGYLDIVALEKNALAVATDSGGLQKEAYFHKVPCITLRDETEWVELVELGWNKVVPPRDDSSICESILNALPGQDTSPGPYGDGNSADLIARELVDNTET